MTRQVRAFSTPQLRISIPWQIAPPLAGMAAGAYLSEFLMFNQDFMGPRTLSSVQIGLLVVVLGPVLMTGFWLLSSRLGAHWLQLSFAAGLQIDAPSYWPAMLLALSPAAALLLGIRLSTYQAFVVLLLTVVLAAISGVKTYRWSRVASSREARLSANFYRRTLTWVLVAFALVVGTLAILGYRAYTSWYLDLALVDQALWNTLHGHFMQYSFYQGIQMSLLADHVEPILLGLLPLYVIWPDPQALLLVRVFALLAATLPIYATTRLITSSRAASLMFALAFLITPMVIESGIRGGGNLRTETLALPFLAVAIYAALSERWRLLYLSAFLALLCKEHISLLIAGLGLYLVVSGRSRKHGWALTGLGVAWFILAVYVFLPWIRHGEPSRHFALSLGALGAANGVTGLLRTLVSDPGRILATVLTPSKLSFIFFSLLALAFLPLLGGISAVVLPVVGLFLLYPATPTLLDYHYLPALPFLMAGAAFAIRKLTRAAAAGDPTIERSTTHALAAVLLACTLTATFFWGSGPLSWGFWRADRPYTYFEDYYVKSDHADYVNRAVRNIPPDVPVIAGDYLLIRLAHRPVLYHFFAPPPTLANVDYGVVDLFEDHIRTPETRREERRLQAELLTGGAFALQTAEDGVLQFAHSTEPGLTARVEVVANPQPQHAVETDLGGRLELLGYDFPATDWLTPGKPYRITYYWKVLPGFAKPYEVRHAIQPESIERLSTDYAIIDTLHSADNEYRIVHLPTHITLPPEKWSAGQTLKETYDFVLPENMPAGAYEWNVGLYATPAWFGIRTDKAGFVPGSQPARIGEITVARNE